MISNKLADMYQASKDNERKREDIDCRLHKEFHRELMELKMILGRACARLDDLIAIYREQDKQQREAATDAS